MRRNALLLVAVLSVLFIGLWIGAKNIQQLLQQQASMILATTSDKVRTHLEPARNQVTLLGRLIAAGEVDPARRDRGGTSPARREPLSGFQSLALMMKLDSK